MANGDYHLARAGRALGVYPEDAMRAYYAEGRVAPDDLVWQDGMAQWLPARQVFGAAASVPSPPSLHWGWVLLISLFTFGLFYIVWAFVQAVWVRKLDAKSNALKLLLACLALTIVGESIADSAAKDSPLVIAGTLVSLGGMVISIVAYFSMRRSLVARYDFKLSWWMTLIFNVLYVQHHLTRIAKRKRGGNLPPQ